MCARLSEKLWNLVTDHDRKAELNSRAKKSGSRENLSMIPMEQWLDMRRRPSLCGAFCARYLKCIVRVQKWNSLFLETPVCEFVTPSDEALVLLMLENSCDRWFDMWKSNNFEESNVPCKCTNGGENEKNGRTAFANIVEKCAASEIGKEELME